MSNKCSNYPQDVLPDLIWYYEFPERIEVVISREWREEATNAIDGRIFKIPRRMLEASLKRMNASRKRKRGEFNRRAQG